MPFASNRVRKQYDHAYFLLNKMQPNCNLVCLVCQDKTFQALHSCSMGTSRRTWGKEALIWEQNNTVAQSRSDSCGRVLQRTLVWYSACATSYTLHANSSTCAGSTLKLTLKPLKDLDGIVYTCSWKYVDKYNGWGYEFTNICMYAHAHSIHACTNKYNNVYSAPTDPPTC